MKQKNSNNLNLQKLFISILILFSAICTLPAENEMQLVREYLSESETNSDHFGNFTAVLDFNGDGYDDLFVNAPNWHLVIDSLSFVSKCYLYLGSFTGLSEEPHKTMISNPDTLFTYDEKWEFIQNLGDMNNDGFDDLGFNGIKSTSLPNPYFVYYAGILLGSAECDTIPDFIYEFPTPTYSGGGAPRIYPLGDINGDGFDDAGIAVQKRISQSVYFYEYSIIYGGTFEKQYLCSFRKRNWYTYFGGIGDINNDQIDDFSIFYKSEEDMNQYLYFGGNEQDSIPDINLSEFITDDTWQSVGAKFCGDWNGDGFDDFVGSNTAPSGVGIWFGGNEIEEANCFLEFFAGYSFNSFGHGDLNNDGYSDIIIGFDVHGGDDGRIYIYLGGENGSCDLTIDGEIWELFGRSIGVGDFDNDGYDDIAIGGPGNYQNYHPGVVRVYAGNGELAETTEPIEPDFAPEIKKIKFNAYPNPFNPSTTIKYFLPKNNFVNLSIYNIKGQKIKELVNEIKSKGNNSVVWNGKDEDGDTVSSGVYFYKIRTENAFATKKILMLK